MPRPVTEQLYDSQEGIHVVLGLYSLLSSIMAHQHSNHCTHQPGMSAQLQPGHVSVTSASSESIESVRPHAILNYGFVYGKTKDGGSWGSGQCFRQCVLDVDVDISTNASGAWDRHRDHVPRL